MILIVTNPEQDGHLRPVANELKRRGFDYCVYDPAAFPHGSALTMENNGRGVRSLLRTREFELDLATVTAVWYRRPGEFDLGAYLTAEETAWLRTECAHLMRAAWEATDALWVSEPEAVRRASLKVTQLRLAATLGFTVPRFVVTNDVDTARNFLRTAPSGAVVKVLAKPVIVASDHGVTFYTHLVTPEDEQLIDSVRYGPTFLQEFVEKRMDLRVTVIGENVFAVGIDSTFLADARVDFRRVETYDLPHKILHLPDAVSRRCLELVRRLGLRFGAIDLLLTPDGEYRFLEINPNGQWYWLEWVTGAPMASALCDLLTSGPADR